MVFICYLFAIKLLRLRESFYFVSNVTLMQFVVQEIPNLIGLLCVGVVTRVFAFSLLHRLCLMFSVVLNNTVIDITLSTLTSL